MKGQFGPNGALYDGWESRRHNPAYDWYDYASLLEMAFLLTTLRVIIRLATPLTSLHYVDIDTSHFNGNEAPQSQVFALSLPSDGSTPKWTQGNPGWVEVLPVVDLGPNSRHIFEVGKAGKEGKWGAVMVNMMPDGGMVSPQCDQRNRSDARLRPDSELMVSRKPLLSQSLFRPTTSRSNPPTCCLLSLVVASFHALMLSSLLQATFSSLVVEWTCLMGGKLSVVRRSGASTHPEAL